jgi:hypothetical protein
MIHWPISIYISIPVPMWYVPGWYINDPLDKKIAAAAELCWNSGEGPYWAM